MCVHWRGGWGLVAIPYLPSRPCSGTRPCDLWNGHRAETNATTACVAGTLVLDLSKAKLVSGKRYSYPKESTWAGALRMGEGTAAAFTLALPKKSGSLKIQWTMDENVKGVDDTMTLKVDSSKTPLVLRASATQHGSRTGVSIMAVLASDSTLSIAANSKSSRSDHHMFIHSLEFVPGLESLVIIWWSNLTTDRPTPTK